MLVYEDLEWRATPAIVHAAQYYLHSYGRHPRDGPDNLGGGRGCVGVKVRDTGGFGLMLTYKGQAREADPASAS